MGASQVHTGLLFSRACAKTHIHTSRNRYTTLSLIQCKKLLVFPETLHVLFKASLPNSLSPFSSSSFPFPSPFDLSFALKKRTLRISPSNMYFSWHFCLQMMQNDTPCQRIPHLSVQRSMLMNSFFGLRSRGKILAVDKSAKLYIHSSGDVDDLMLNHDDRLFYFIHLKRRGHIRKHPCYTKAHKQPLNDWVFSCDGIEFDDLLPFSACIKLSISAIFYGTKTGQFPRHCHTRLLIGSYCSLFGFATTRHFANAFSLDFFGPLFVCQSLSFVFIVHTSKWTQTLFVLLYAINLLQRSLFSWQRALMILDSVNFQYFFARYDAHFYSLAKNWNFRWSVSLPKSSGERERKRERESLGEREREREREREKEREREGSPVPLQFGVDSERQVSLIDRTEGNHGREETQIQSSNSNSSLQGKSGDLQKIVRLTKKLRFWHTTSSSVERPDLSLCVNTIIHVRSTFRANGFIRNVTLLLQLFGETSNLLLHWRPKFTNWMELDSWHRHGGRKAECPHWLVFHPW